jgi:hypothetical protein
MGCLTPDWQQPRPTWEETRTMCRRVQLTPLSLTSAVLNEVVTRLRESHSNGGALLSAFQISPDDAFDWFASRNRLLEHGILQSILSRPEIREGLPELMIPAEPDHAAIAPSCPIGDANGFKMNSPFLFDGLLADYLYSGGAYWQSKGNGNQKNKWLSTSAKRSLT